ncbi:MAG: InlB B-repeat-containing protein, partial [Acidimicrobiales bacterium]
GYTFTGWNTDPGGSGTAYTDQQSITIYADLTLYAQWSANSDTVTFDGNGGSGSMSLESYTSGVAKALTRNSFTWPGYTFAGWNTAANGTGTAYTDGESITIYATVTLYAEWEGMADTITFNANGGSGSMSSESYTSGVAQALNPNSFTWPGYTFTGWNLSADGTQLSYTDGESVMFYANLTLYAQWSANSEDVTFEPNGGSGSMSPESYTSGVAQALNPSTFTWSGYTFTGWNTAADGTGRHYANFQVITISVAITLFAQWSASSEDVTFKSNGGSGSMSPESYTSGVGKALTPNAFVRTGYTFTGWNTAANGTGGHYDNRQVITIDAAMTLYAQWAGRTERVTFKSNGGSGSMSPESYRSGVAKALTSNTFVRTGYRFTGWNTAAKGTGRHYANGQRITIDAAMTLYAQWAGRTERVTFKPNGGSGSMRPESYRSGVAKALTPNTFTRTGYTFAGWSTAARATGRPYANGQRITIDAALTLYAQWKAKPV